MINYHQAENKPCSPIMLLSSSTIYCAIDPSLVVLDIDHIDHCHNMIPVMEGRGDVPVRTQTNGTENRGPRKSVQFRLTAWELTMNLRVHNL